MGQYDTAQVCLNGHCVNSSYHTSPEFNKNFCDRCGEQTIISCHVCGTEIRGRYEVGGAFTVGFRYTTPDYCFNCGKPFPWLDKKMKAVVELAELEEVLTAEELAQLKVYTKDITTDTPNAQVSAKKITILFRKFTSNALPAIRALFVDIASETAKKILKDQG